MSDDEEVGYRHPPAHRQFGQPGGNVRGPGRRKHSKNVATIFAATAGATVAAKDGNGKTRKITKLEAAMTQLANKAASGDLKAIGMLLVMAQGLEMRAEEHQVPDVVLNDADRKVIALMADRIKKQLESVSDG